MRRFVVPGLLCLLVAATPLTAQRLPAAEPMPSWGSNAPARSLVRSGDRIFLGGDFTSVAEPTGGLATIGATDATDVRTLAPQPARVVRLESDGIGGWLAIAQQFNSHITRLMRLGADGTPHAQWVEPVFTTRSPDYAPLLEAVAVAGSRVFVVGTFSTVNGFTRRGLAALDLTTGAVLSWDPRIDERPAPTAVTGSVSGFTATVRWQPGPAPTATSYVVEAGTAPGAANVGRFSVGAATEVSGTLPPGTYYVRVYGVDEEGESVASDEVVLQVPTGLTLPGAPGALTSAVAGSVVSLSWGTATGATSYVVDAGRMSGATDIGSFPMGGATSFSGPVPPGAYFVRIRGVNAAGAGPPSNEVVVTVP